MPVTVVRKNPIAARLSEPDARQLHVSRTAIEFVPIDSIKSNPRNAKRHPEQQVALIAENIRKLGFHHPILIDETNMNLGGHARVAAAQRLGLKEVPAIRLSNLSRQEKRAVALADNKLAEHGRWDLEMLRLELKELTVDAGDLSFDYTLTGFGTVEIDQILGDEGPVGRPDPADKIPPMGELEASVTQSGDLWVCDQHRLYCDSALEESSYRAVLNGELADLVFVDLLGNLPLADHVSRWDEARDYATPARHPTSAEFIEVLQTTSAYVAGNISPGAVVYVWLDWRHLEDLATATRLDFGEPRTWWSGSNPVLREAPSIGPNTSTSRCMWPAKRRSRLNFALANAAAIGPMSGPTRPLR